MNFVDILIAWLVTASSLLLVSKIPFVGLEIDSPQKGIASAAVLGILNVLILPVLKAVFFIPNVLTLGLLSGLFAFVMNIVILSIAAKVVTGFRLNLGIWSAVLGAIALAVVSNLINGFLAA